MTSTDDDEVQRLKQNWRKEERICPTCGDTTWLLPYISSVGSLHISCVNCGHIVAFRRQLAARWDGTRCKPKETQREQAAVPKHCIDALMTIKVKTITVVPRGAGATDLIWLYLNAPTTHLNHIGDPKARVEAPAGQGVRWVRETFGVEPEVIDMRGPRL